MHVEQHVQFLERALAFLQAITGAARRSQGRVELAREACRLAVELGGMRMAWFARVDPRTGLVHPVAHHGHEDGYILQTSITTREEPRGRGPTGRALREKRPIVCSDIERDPEFAPWRSAALARGYRSAAAIPIVVDGVAVATLNVYAAERDLFKPSMVRLLAAVADVLSLAEERAAPHEPADRRQDAPRDASALRTV